MSNCKRKRHGRNVYKARHATREEAEQARQELIDSIDHPHEFTVYRCPRCSFWHVGRHRAVFPEEYWHPKQRKVHEEMLVGKIIGILRGTYPGHRHKRKSV